MSPTTLWGDWVGVLGSGGAEHFAQGLVLPGGVVSVVNALAHRDWTRYEEMEVVCYVDRLEVLSPGALNDSMTLEKMITGRRSARNPLIVNVLCDYGYATRIRGVRNKIIPLTQFRQTCEMCQKCAHNYFETYNVICDYRVSALRSTSRLLYPYCRSHPVL